MSDEISVWTRVKRFFRPPTETYETRENHPAEQGPLATQKYEATDQRRHGGTGAMGA